VRAGADGYDAADVVVDRTDQRTSVDLDLARK